MRRVDKKKLWLKLMIAAVVIGDCRCWLWPNLIDWPGVRGRDAAAGFTAGCWD